MDGIVAAIAIAGAIALAVQSLVFLLASCLRRDDIVDVWWGLTFVTIVGGLIAIYPAAPLGYGLVGLVSVWGLRLSYHIWTRWKRSSSEDPRYVELRKSWPASYRALNRYLRIFVVQALLATMIAAPVIVGIARGGELGLWAAVGAVIWMVGFCCELVADYQLGHFLRQNQSSGTLMTSGLWRYSRHPNYFGEMVMWWGLWIASLETGIWWTVIGPIVITVLLTKVSGVPLAEQRASRKKGWNEYKQTTSVLIPWIPGDRR